MTEHQKHRHRTEADEAREGEGTLGASRNSAGCDLCHGAGSAQGTEQMDD